MAGVRRRRSTSLGEGDPLSSTLNLPEVRPMNRFNTDRCMSTPQINTTGFIDDNYWSNRGTRFEPRPRTRSRGGANTIDKRLRDNFIQIRDEIFEWGRVSSTSAQSVAAINGQYRGFYIEIERRINEAMLTRGDFNLVAEYESLRDKLNTVRRVARQLAEARVLPDPYSLDQETDAYSCLPLMTRSLNQDHVFQYDPISLGRATSSTPSTRREEFLGTNLDDNMIMARGQEFVRMNSEPARSKSPCSEANSSELDRGMSGAIRDGVRRENSGVVSGSGSMEMDPDPASLPTPASQSQVGGNDHRLARINDPHAGTESWIQSITSKQLIMEGRIEEVLRIIQGIQAREHVLKGIQEELNVLSCNVNNISLRVDRTEQGLERFEGKLIRLETTVEQNMLRVQDWFVEISTKTPSSEVPEELINTLREVINNSSPGIVVEGMRTEIEEIRDSLDQNRYTTEGLRTVMADLSDQVVNASMNAAEPNPTVRLDDDTETNRREREIVRKGIERTEKQLRQIILNDLETTGMDISLIKKFKTVDVPAVHVAVGSMQKSLLNYVKFSGMDPEYCEVIDELLDSAENWCLKVEELYNKAEVHSINTAKGDASDVGVFSDNAKVTVYEFLESAEIAYLGWGNSVQKANRLYNHHLSEEIKSKLINMSDSYAEMKSWLIINYGGASRIVSDILRDLSRKPKPSNSNSGATFSFYAYISGAIQRLERLAKVRGINKAELETCLYSRATLTSLSLVLPNHVHADWITEMTRAGLDYKNPVGIEAYKVFKNLCIIERNKSEGSRDLEKPVNEAKPRSPRSPRANKPRSVHKAGEDKQAEEEREATAFATSFHNSKWYQAGLKFLCPIEKQST